MTTHSGHRLHIVGNYAFMVVPAHVGLAWHWIVLYKGEHLDSGSQEMWSLAEYAARETIRKHSTKEK